MTPEFVALMQAQNVYNHLWSQVMTARQSEAALKELDAQLSQALANVQKAFDAWRKAAVSSSAV